VGNSLPHDNMMPYLVITYIVSLQGIFPSRN
jgi:microcystin-dependent protein